MNFLTSFVRSIVDKSEITKHFTYKKCKSGYKSFKEIKKILLITVLTFPNKAKVASNRSVTPEIDLYDNLRKVQNKKFTAP
jgi:hypothetical protein